MVIICSRENPPEVLDLSLVGREIFTQEPRVTRVPIMWDHVNEIAPPDNELVAQAMDDENSRSLGVE